MKLALAPAVSGPRAVPFAPGAPSPVSQLAEYLMAGFPLSTTHDPVIRLDIRRDAGSSVGDREEDVESIFSRTEMGEDGLTIR